MYACRVTVFLESRQKGGRQILKHKLEFIRSFRVYVILSRVVNPIASVKCSIQEEYVVSRLFRASYPFPHTTSPNTVL